MIRGSIESKMICVIGNRRRAIWERPSLPFILCTVIAIVFAAAVKVPVLLAA